MPHAENDPVSPPQTVGQLTRKNIQAVVKLEEATNSHATFADRISDRINRFCGSMSFVYLHALWFAIWIFLNTAASKKYRFDPFPFSFLTLMVSLEAIFLSSFILLSQNRQSALSERRAQLDLQINMLSEQENTKMLCLLRLIARKLGVEDVSDKEIELLAKALQPEQLARHIDESQKRAKDATVQKSASGRSNNKA
jgi:uncharacterized membrane protein